MKVIAFSLAALAATSLSPGLALAADAETLYQAKACVACHKIDGPMVGPSYQDVAKKYAGQDGAAATLAKHIQEGSQGIWGAIPMPPNAVTDEEAKTLAEWILQQK